MSNYKRVGKKGIKVPKKKKWNKIWKKLSLSNKPIVYNNNRCFFFSFSINHIFFISFELPIYILCVIVLSVPKNPKNHILFFSNLLFVYHFTSQETEEKMLQQTTGIRRPLRWNIWNWDCRSWLSWTWRFQPSIPNLF